MTRHYEGARGAVICDPQLSLVIVLEPKYGDMEHTTIMVSESLFLLHSLPFHALDEAELARAHVGERGSHVRLRVLAEPLLLGCLAVQLQRWSRAVAAGGGNLASRDVAIPMKANPGVELPVKVCLAAEWQGPLPMPSPHRILGVE